MTINKTSQKSIQLLENSSDEKLCLGRYLWAIREGEEMTQTAFGKLIGVSRQYICDLENGRRFVSPKAAAKFARTLGYSEEQFVRLCLQDLIEREGINAEIDVKLQKKRRAA